jgi:outer membrane protein assembly factor BamB
VPNREQLQRWFDTVVGHGHRWSDTRTEFGVCGTLEGLVRYRGPIGDDIALRLSFDPVANLQFHCWSGQRGISFIRYGADQQRWLAFATTRQAEDAVPATWSLVASDAGRNRRSALRITAPVELRQRDGRLILSRGDIVLLQAPLAEPLTDLFVAGKATFHGITVVRTKDGPAADDQWPEVTRQPPVGIQSLQAAELPWQGDLGDGGRWEPRAAGAVQFTSNGAKRVARSVALPGQGLREILVRLEDCSPGTSLFLARGDKPTGNHLRWMTNPALGNGQWVWTADDDRAEAPGQRIVDTALNASSASSWLRLIVGCGVVRTWRSDDGIYWAEMQPPLKIATDGLTHLGLQHVARAKPGSVTISALATRPLDLIEELADPALVARVPDLTAAKDAASWVALVDKNRPADLDNMSWQTACALRTLQLHREATLELPVFERLIAAAIEKPGDVAQRTSRLVQLSSACDLYEATPLVNEFVKRFHKLGMDAFQREGARPHSLVRRSLLSLPLETRAVVMTYDPASVRAELLQLLYAGNWQEAIQWMRTLRYFNQHEQTALIPWADNLARRMTPGRDAPAAAGNTVRERGRTRPGRGFFFGGPRTIPSRTGIQWLHPLQEELSKEAYNTFAELESLLSSEAYDDAARMVAQLQPDSVPGLAPLSTDDELLVSLASAVPWFLGESPALAEAMRQRYRDIAPLRVRQALQAGDPAGVQLVARQFIGTEAAALAEQWLGDRALAAGDFATARAAYQRAQRTIAADARPALSARQHLTAALLGIPPETAAGGPSGVTSSVTSSADWNATVAVALGDKSISGSDFAAVLAALRSRTTALALSENDAQRTRHVPEAPPPADYQTTVRAPLDGLVGEQPNDEVVRNVTKLKIDWPARQLGYTTSGDWLIVNNRFHLAAYKVSDNLQRKWQSVLPEGKRMMRTRDWSLVSMTPRVVGDSIFARQLLQEGPLLGSWNLADGKLNWLADGLKSMPIASDPWMVQDRLQALTIARQDNQDSVLRLATFDPDTGELLQQVDLARVTTVWHTRHVCETILVDDTIIAVLGGFVLACDTRGQVRWIRKQVLLPADEELDWVAQAIQKPLAHDGRLLITQPGVRAVDCLETATGALLWRRYLPDLRHVVAVDGSRVFVATDSGFIALSAEDGQPQWRHTATDLLQATWAGSPRGLTYATTNPPKMPSATGNAPQPGTTTPATPAPTPAPGAKVRPHLVWLDPATGAVQRTSELPSLEDVEPRLGPALTIGTRYFSFFGRGLQDPKRELIELTPR